MEISERLNTLVSLRASEERLRLMMDSFTDVALFTTDTDTVVSAWNPGAEKIFGFTAAEMVGKQSADVVFTPEDRMNGVPEKERRSAVENGKALDERWHIRKSGERFFASGFMVPLTDGEKLIGYGKIASDLTERKHFEQEFESTRRALEERVAERTRELAESNELLKREIAERVHAERERVQLLRRIVTTQEEERRRIARDLHDHLGQQMTSMRLQLQSILEACDDDDLCDKVKDVQRQAEQFDRGVDFLAWELRPAALDDLGLRVTLANFVKEWSRYTGIIAEFHTNGLGRNRLPFEIETNLYRIGQEALNNILKHAKAKNVSVLMEKRGNTISLIIEDDGVGFNPTSTAVRKRGIGLASMRERAAIIGGGLDIESAPRKGTTIFVKIPLTPKTEKE
jgi:PAS domain S-box-containing protein